MLRSLPQYRPIIRNIDEQQESLSAKYTRAGKVSLLFKDGFTFFMPEEIYS